MNVTFQEAANNSAISPHQRSRQFVEQLRKFIQAAENPNASAAQAGAGLSDVGFLLLRLKDQLLSTDQRNIGFPGEFASKQHNGLVLLIKVVVVLQGIINLVNNKASKFSSLLNRKNSATNVRRKASVSEADCMECIKLILEKAPHVWQILLENPQNLEVILYSINSPQLDSKCYALEIVIGLLDQSHGFEHLFRSLTMISARTGDYMRLSIIISQLKHGLHTSKLHIQILVAKLMNKLLLRAPSSHHRMLIQAEASLAHYSVDYVEKLLINNGGLLGGREVLNDELAIWRNLCSSTTGTPNAGNSTRSADSGHHRVSQLNSYESSEDSSRNRRGRTAFKNPPAQTSVTKNIERQRLRRHGDTPNYYHHESLHTLSKSRENLDGLQSPQRMFGHDDFERMGRMRRVKSESAMGVEEPEEDHYSTQNRRLKRFGVNDYSEYATPPNATNSMFNAKMSQSIHDLSSAHLMSPPLINSMPPRSAEAPGKFYTGNPGVYAQSGQNEFSTLNRVLRRTVSPAYSNADSQPEQPGLPGYPSAQIPPTHGGFSYLFPTLPMVDRVSGRTRSPEVYVETPMSPHSNHISPRSRQTYDYQPAISPRSGQPLQGQQAVDSSGNVVYIPINMVEKQQNDALSPRMAELSPPSHERYHDTSMSNLNTDGSLHNRHDKRRHPDNGAFSEGNAGMQKHAASPHSSTQPPAPRDDKNNQNYATATPLGKDVRDALREFDYLNDYEASSVRSGTISHNPTAIYHF
uniref:Armadillo-type protein n=1 Tax=Panagrellus redivivus TaxID=6233 RepID=A0A7E4W434_PANRE